ncbi:hypothetical protein [Cohnella ginsengisoli]
MDIIALMLLFVFVYSSDTRLTEAEMSLAMAPARSSDSICGST